MIAKQYYHNCVLLVTHRRSNSFAIIIIGVTALIYDLSIHLLFQLSHDDVACPVTLSVLSSALGVPQ